MKENTYLGVLHFAFFCTGARALTTLRDPDKTTKKRRKACREGRAPKPKRRKPQGAEGALPARVSEYSKGSKERKNAEERRWQFMFEWVF